MANPTRRSFLKTACAATLTGALIPALESCGSAKHAVAGRELFFQISLAEWSLHRTIRAGKMTNLDFPLVAKRDFGISAVEYVNQFFKDKAKDAAYLKDLKQRCSDNGVKSVLIMIDGEGNLGEQDAAKRKQAVENHYKWVEAAQMLGCHGIRVNTHGEGSAEEVAKASVESLTQLTNFAKAYNINIMVENHGGYSGTIGLAGRRDETGRDKIVRHLPDFGNFCMRYEGTEGERKCVEWSDRYEVTSQFMPYALGVSAKSYDFRPEGNCIETDYRKMLKIVRDGGYRGYIGIEYEGDKLSEADGIKATKALLERLG